MNKLAVILVGLFVLSCQDIENCGTNDDRDFMVVRFFDLKSQDTKKIGFTIKSKDITYMNIYSSDSTVVFLPLNPKDSSTSFFFISDTSNHELVMRHDVEVSIFDSKCDPSVTFLNLDILRQTFDSIKVVGRVTNRQLNTNVEVYF